MRDRTPGSVTLVLDERIHIQRFADRHARPFVAKILADGRVEDAT